MCAFILVVVALVTVRPAVASAESMIDTFRDPEFLAEAEKRGLGLNAIRTGEQLQDFMARMYQTPAHLVERVRKLSGN